MPVPGCLDYTGFVIQFDTRYCDSSYFLKITEAIQGYLWFHINFCNVFSISLKYSLGTLIEIALNL